MSIPPPPTVPLGNDKAWQSIAIPLETPYRIDIKTTSVTIPLLIVRRVNAHGLMIMSNGAVDLEKTHGDPIFQRSSWWKDISQHQLYICDPGTTGNNALSLSWGQINEDYWFIPDASDAVKIISSLLGVVSPENRTYFGSSAGGFLSIALLAHDAGASALVNNVQFDWTKWMAGGVNKIRHARFSGKLPKTLREEYPTRTNVLRLLSHKNQVSPIHYCLNTASRHDTSVDLPEINNFREKNTDLSKYIQIHAYRDPVAGHNPLGKAQTVNLINQFPLEDPNRKITFPHMNSITAEFDIPSSVNSFRPAIRLSKDIKSREIVGLITGSGNPNLTSDHVDGYKWSAGLNGFYRYINGEHSAGSILYLPRLHTKHIGNRLSLQLIPWGNPNSTPDQSVDNVVLDSIARPGNLLIFASKLLRVNNEAWEVSS